jgi:hypothetical protein
VATKSFLRPKPPFPGCHLHIKFEAQMQRLHRIILQDLRTIIRSVILYSILQFVVCEKPNRAAFFTAAPGLQTTLRFPPTRRTMPEFGCEVTLSPLYVCVVYMCVYVCYAVYSNGGSLHLAVWVVNLAKTKVHRSQWPHAIRYLHA